MKEKPQLVDNGKRTLGTQVAVQTVRLLPEERAHLLELQKTAVKEHKRRVPFNEIMVKGLMRLKRA